MFISRMALNGARRQSAFLLSSPHAMHAAVLASFPPGSAHGGEEGRVLWRVDREPSNAIWLYVVSPQRPDMTHLVEQAGWPTTSAWECRDYLPFLSRVTTGQHWAFRLTANPVRTVTAETGASKRLAHVTAAQQVDWLLERVDQHGFIVTDGGADTPNVLISRREKKSFRRGEGTVTLATAQFDGVLEVTDAGLLRRAMQRGIGRGKGYGCGLLTLVPSAS